MALNADTLARTLADLDRRLRGVERSSQSARTSVETPSGETLVLADAAARGVAAADVAAAAEATADAAQAAADAAAADVAAAVADIDNAVTTANAAASGVSTLTTLTDGWKATDGVSIDGGALYADSIGAGKIATDAILARHVKAGELTAAKLAAGTITAASGVIGSIDAAKITVGKITAAQMATGTITAASGVIGDIDAAKITTGTMNGARITAGTITADRLSATAIDGKTITGATFRTAASGRRWTIDSNVGVNMILGYTGISGEQPGSFAMASTGASVDLNMSSPVVNGGAASLSLKSPRPGYESDGAEAFIGANGAASLRISEKYGVQIGVPDNIAAGYGIALNGPLGSEYGGFAMNPYTTYLFNAGNRGGGYVGTATAYWWQIGALVYVAGTVSATQATTTGTEVMLPVEAPRPNRRLLACGTLGVFGSGYPTDQSGLSFMSATMDSLICVSYSNGYRNAAAGNSVRFFCWYDITQ